MSASLVTRSTLLSMVIALVLSIDHVSAFIVDIVSLVSEPARHDQQTVTVIGTAGPIRDIRLTVGSTNQTVRFDGFLVIDKSGAYVFVIHQAHIGGAVPASGSRVEVTGIFHGHWKAIQATRGYTLK